MQVESSTRSSHIFAYAVRSNKRLCLFCASFVPMPMSSLAGIMRIIILISVIPNNNVRHESKAVSFLQRRANAMACQPSPFHRISFLQHAFLDVDPPIACSTFRAPVLLFRFLQGQDAQRASVVIAVEEPSSW